DGCFRTATAVNRDIWLLPAPDLRIGPPRSIELALVIKGCWLGPGSTQQGEVFRRAAIPSLVAGPVAVLGLIGVASAGNDVHRQTTAAQLVEGRQFAGGKRRRHKAWPVRQQKLKPFGYRRRMRPDQEPVGCVGEIADQDAVKPGAFMDAGRLGDPPPRRRAGRRPGSAPRRPAARSSQ